MLSTAAASRSSSPGETTTEKIKTMAYACGYEDPNYFAKGFRKAQGVSPREYRNTRPSRGRG